MSPREAWGAFSLLYVLAAVAACAALLSVGLAWYVSLACAIVLLMTYGYIVYKRYRVEVVPEGDIGLFDDPDDLRILCEIYGLDPDGQERTLRSRLVGFARANDDAAFVWVSPKAVHVFGTSLEVGQPPATVVQPPIEYEDVPGLVTRMVTDTGTPVGLRALTGGKARSSTRLSSLKACPVCDSPLPKGAASCRACGADLEFYAVLSETAIGKRLISQKAAVAERRKLRYPVPQLRDR